MTDLEASGTAIGPTMRAVRLLSPGGPGALVLEEIAVPDPAPGEALIRVHAAALTKDELEWPEDRLPAIPSYEVSGTVAAVATDVETVSVGDAVYALTRLRPGRRSRGLRRGGGGAPGAEAPRPRRRPERGDPAPGAVRVAGSVRSRRVGGGTAGADHRRGRRRRAPGDPARASPRRARDRHGVPGEQGRRSGVRCP